MKISEILLRTHKVMDVQPAPVQRQARVNQVVSQIAASDQQKPASEMDKVMAMRKYANIKKQAKQNYVSSLQQQLASVAPKCRTKQ